MRIYVSKITTSQEDVRNHAVAHSIISACYRRERGRVLFRVEQDANGGPCLLAYSAAKPDDIATASIATREVNFAISKGTSLRFQIRANPVRRFGNDRKRWAIKDPELQKEWFKNQAETNGFSLVDLSLSQEGTIQVARFPNPISIESATFKGTLVVIDPDRFENCLLQGIGPSKAFGFGLLTIRKS